MSEPVIVDRLAHCMREDVFLNNGYNLSLQVLIWYILVARPKSIAIYFGNKKYIIIFYNLKILNFVHRPCYSTDEIP